MLAKESSLGSIKLHLNNTRIGNFRAFVSYMCAKIFFWLCDELFLLIGQKQFTISDRKKQPKEPNIKILAGFCNSKQVLPEEPLLHNVKSILWLVVRISQASDKVNVQQ